VRLLKKAIAISIASISSLAWGQYTISRVAGSSRTTGVAATDSYIPSPAAVAWDRSGGFYFAGGNRVFHVSAAGVIDRIYGTDAPGFGGDGGLASASTVRFNFYPWVGLAVDRSNNLYISDPGNGRVRKIDGVSEILTTIAGDGGPSEGGDGGLATNAQLGVPVALATDSVGNVYIGDGGRIRKVTVATGIITTYVGQSGAFLGTFDGVPASNTPVEPNGLAFDRNDNLYIADGGYDLIRKVTAATGIVTTIAGNGMFDDTGDGGPATSAAIYLPTSVAVDSAGNVYFSSLRTFRKVDTHGIISDFGHSLFLTPYYYSGDTNYFANIPPEGAIAIDQSDNILYGNIYSLLVLQIDVATGRIHTIAGNRSGLGDDGPASDASLSVPAGVAVDTAGNPLYLGFRRSARKEGVGCYWHHHDSRGDRGKRVGR